MLWLSAWRLLSGLGAAWVFACGGTLVQQLYRNRPALYGAATGLFFTGSGIGIVASGLLLDPLLARWGNTAWPSAWLVLGLLALLASLWPLWLARRGEQADADADAAAVARGRIPLGRLGAGLAAYFCFAAGYIVYMTFIFAWVRGQGLSWIFGTALWTLLGVAVGLSPLLWQRALGRWPAAYTLSASGLATAVGTWIALWGDGWIWPLVSAAVYGASVFIIPSAVAVLLRQRLPAALMARAMALSTVVFALGQVLGPVLAGWIADRHGLSASLWLGVALLGLVAVLPWAGPRGAR